MFPFHSFMLLKNSKLFKNTIFFNLLSEDICIGKTENAYFRAEFSANGEVSNSFISII
jgi:hypothetical protein